MKNIILASASPRRKELLSLLTQNFDIITSEVDESVAFASSPFLLAKNLAALKCNAVAQSYPNSIVIGSDTVVECDGIVFGKPTSESHAIQMLTALSGKTHLVHTGVCISLAQKQALFAVTTRVTFAPLTNSEIEAYAKTKEPYDKAGGYGIQGYAARFITGINGCYYNVMGLPVQQVYTHLKSFNAFD